MSVITFEAVILIILLVIIDRCVVRVPEGASQREIDDALCKLSALGYSIHRPVLASAHVEREFDDVL